MQRSPLSPNKRIDRYGSSDQTGCYRSGDEKKPTSFISSLIREGRVQIDKQKGRSSGLWVILVSLVFPVP